MTDGTLGEKRPDDETGRGVCEPRGGVMPETRTTEIGVGLAAAIMVGWLVTHVSAVFFFPVNAQTIPLVPIVVALQSWLSVGLFIIAHDAIHGTLAPSRKRLNNSVGRIAINLYGGFNFDALARAHHQHHRYSGTDADPDFSTMHPQNPLLWAWVFFRRHTTLRCIIYFNIVFNVELHVLGADQANVLLFFALPAVLSALQLFYFGTFLPHKHEDESEFSDEHRARSSEFGPLMSLLTCYHFGYHHEHHLYPFVPWWRLPEARRKHARAA
jgi:beta-carotene ketolase (CrtW type)